MSYYDEKYRKYDDVLTVEELMDYLAIGKNTAYKLLKEEKIKSFRIGTVYKIPKRSSESILEKVADKESCSENYLLNSSNLPTFQPFIN